MVDCFAVALRVGFYVIVWVAVLLFIVMANSVDLI